MLGKVICLFLVLAVLSDAAPFPIEHIVVLMEENRSFDHMLGWMKRTRPEIDGLTGTEFNPYSTTDPNGKRAYVDDKAPYVARFDPDHGLPGTTLAIFGDKDGKNETMAGFVQRAIQRGNNPPSDLLNMFAPESIPIITTLVNEFALFDRWFCSVPGPTFPNRMYLLSATSHGAIDNNVPPEGWPQKTIFDALDEAKLSWNIFYRDIMWSVFLHNLRTTHALDRYRPWDYFLQAAKAGQLPTFTFLEPRMAMDPFTGEPSDDQHPDHTVLAGESLMKQVYEALRASPQWNSTLLIITYDEHGGFYDHVPPPRGVPNPDGIKPPPAAGTFNFDRLGVRVPMVMISPWINKGTLIHRPKGPEPTSEFEHSSLSATLHKIWGTSLLTKRDAWAGTFESVINRDSPRTDCPEKLPPVPTPPPTSFGARDIPEGELPANGLQCDALKFFPGSHGNCDMTQKEVAHYVNYLTTNLKRNLKK